jgi:hypothetical protein
MGPFFWATTFGHNHGLLVAGLGRNRAARSAPGASGLNKKSRPATGQAAKSPLAAGQTVKSPLAAGQTVKSPLAAGFCSCGAISRLLQLDFLEQHMFARLRVEFHEFKLLGRGLLVLVGGVEKAGTRSGFQLDLFATAFGCHGVLLDC